MKGDQINLPERPVHYHQQRQLCRTESRKSNNIKWVCEAGAKRSHDALINRWAEVAPDREFYAVFGRYIFTYLNH